MAKKTAQAETTKALAPWDEELAKAAQAAAAQEKGVGGGSFISVRGGILSVNGAAVPGNTFAAVVLDAIMENTYYDVDFDPDSPGTPACYAFGRDDDEMGPHDEAEDKQAEACGGCEKNQWGSAEKGRGKACANRRRLALIPAGTLDKVGSFAAFEDEEQFSKPEILFMKVPTTSVKGWAAYVNKLTSTMLRPAWAVFTQISVVPDAKTQFKVVFEALDKVPTELLGAVKARVEEAKASIEAPYPKAEEKPAKAPAPAPKGKRRF